MPMTTSLKDHLTCLHHPGLKRHDKMHSTAAEQVIATQKFTCGAVHGENITVHRTNARTNENTNFFMSGISLKA